MMNVLLFRTTDEFPINNFSLIDNCTFFVLVEVEMSFTKVSEFNVVF